MMSAAPRPPGVSWQAAAPGPPRNTRNGRNAALIGVPVLAAAAVAVVILFATVTAPAASQASAGSSASGGQTVQPSESTVTGGIGGGAAVAPAPSTDTPSNESGRATDPTDTGSGGGYSDTEIIEPVDAHSAHLALLQQVADDRPAAEELTGYWVPQLSSKRPGVVDDGITYDYLTIWRNYQDLKAQYPDALLLWSGDFESFEYSDFWVVVVPPSYSDGDSANGWCDSEEIAPGDCYAKLLEHAGGSGDTSVLRN